MPFVAVVGVVQVVVVAVAAVYLIWPGSVFICATSVVSTLELWNVYLPLPGGGGCSNFVLISIYEVFARDIDRARERETDTHA